MFYYNFYYKIILIRYFNSFNKTLIEYITGRYDENEFKVLRLQYGLYRQKKSYMYRIGVPCGEINFNQFYLLSYICFFYDKNYIHFTTRTNIQINWLKLFYFFEILRKISFLFLNSIQTSGNCVRNITSSFDYDFLKSNPWGEIIRQWFNLNFEFLYLPRKFKISILISKKDNIAFKTHDIGLDLKRNNFNDLIFNILIGGGLGRTPVLGVYLINNVYWKNILSFLNKIIRIYNIYGFRNNIYKSRLKILIKSLNFHNFLNFLNKEYNYSFEKIYMLTEKELNLFFLKKNLKYLKNIKIKILSNLFFLNWLKNNYNDNIFFLTLKNYNKPPGDINFFQIKILFFFLKNIFFLKIFNRQNITFNFLNIIYFNFLKFKKYFFNIFNFNLLTDIICCPGKDYCNLANSKSILISLLILNIFKDFNSLFKIGEIFLNISGCINSCAHHHVANIGFLGVNKNNEDYYQIYYGGNYNNYNSLKFSSAISSSFSFFKINIILIKILKFFLINNLKKINSNFDFFNLKSSI